jgi:hypothetical protein
LSRQDLQQGRLQHINQLTAYDENKIVLVQRNFIAEMYKFSMRCLFPCIVPIRYVALYCLQSGQYIPSPEWLKRFAKIDVAEAQSLWDIIYSPKKARLEDSDLIFFESRSVGRQKERYYIAGPISSCLPDLSEENVDA